MIKKLHIKKNDTVKVLSGKDKGKIGLVLKVYPKTYRAVVQGINIKTHFIKKENNQPGRIEKKESPVYLSKLMLVDPLTNKPTRIGRKKDENGKLQRYSKKTDAIIKNV